MLELYDPNHRPYRTSSAEIVTAMERHGYRAFVLDREGLARPFGDAYRNVIYNVFFATEPARYGVGA